MRRPILGGLALALVTVVAGAGCTCVAVRRAEQSTEGLRYYLPQPFLIVTPQEDGSIEAHVESIADRSQAYAVSAVSYLANHRLVVKLNQGMLTEVSLTENQAAVAEAAVKAAGEVEKARIQFEMAEADAATKVNEERKAAVGRVGGFDKVARPGPVILRIQEDAATPGVLQLVPVNFEGEPQRLFDAYEGPALDAGRAGD